MRIIFGFMLLFLGCGYDPLSSHYLCKDGVLYVKTNGAWIEALSYKANKCLPMDDGK